MGRRRPGDTAIRSRVAKSGSAFDEVTDLALLHLHHDAQHRCAGGHPQHLWMVFDTYLTHGPGYTFVFKTWQSPTKGVSTFLSH